MIKALGYLGFAASDLAAWRTFGGEVLGMMPADGPDGDLRFRVDERDWRIAVEPGESDDIAFVGFEVAGASELEAMRQRLIEAGVTVEAGDMKLRGRRGVVDLFRCVDPDGLSVEIYYGGTERHERPFVSSTAAKFLTEGQGLGHVVLSTPNIDAVRRFYVEILGFKLSDYIHMQITEEFGFDLEFFHCNARHHTLALAPVPGGKRLNHFMLQVTALDDVGFALDRVTAAGVKVTATLGRHTNDHMVSFYAATPSGFDVEFGWGAREVDEVGWQVVRHERTSTWGHKRGMH